LILLFCFLAGELGARAQPVYPISFLLLFRFIERDRDNQNGRGVRGSSKVRKGKDFLKEVVKEVAFV
jgi:hypothetical protein